MCPDQHSQIYSQVGLRLHAALFHSPRLPGDTSGKVPTCQAGGIRDADLIPESKRFSGERNYSPLQYSCLENPMDRRAWWVTYTQSIGLQRAGHDWRDLAHILGTAAACSSVEMNVGFISTAAYIRCCNSSVLNRTAFYWLLFSDSSPIVAVRLLCCLLGSHM